MEGLCSSRQQEPTTILQIGLRADALGPVVLVLAARVFLTKLASASSELDEAEVAIVVDLPQLAKPTLTPRSATQC